MFLLLRHTPRSVVYYVHPLHFWIREFLTHSWPFFSTKSAPEYGTEGYTKGLLNFLYIFFLAHRTGQSQLLWFMYDVEFRMGRGARNIDHLALVGKVLHMNVITLHFFSMVFADILEEMWKIAVFQTWESKRCQKLWFWLYIWI